MSNPIERRTLRDFGFESCEHPDGTIAYDHGPHHCGYCGATKQGDVWTGGSLDYRIDVIIMQLRGKRLAENVQ